jgi:hypothetical protein
MADKNGGPMVQYFVEGLFIPKKALKKTNKAVEPYAKVVWAGSPAEAIRIASEELAGGQWVEGPTVSNTTEEQRMRQIGAPELPGFGTRKPSGARKPRTRRGGLLVLLAGLSLLVAWGTAQAVQAGLTGLSSIFAPLVLRAPAPKPVQAPVLKWQRGGCYSSWCETGWYSSPAVADLDGNGTYEVIGGQYTFTILNGTDGSLVKRVGTTDNRIWPGIVVSDLEPDGKLEIVTAKSGGYVSVYDYAGNLKWSKQPTPGSELRSLAVSDLDGNGSLEVLVASTRSSNQWYVYNANGTLYPAHWPQLAPSSPGYAAGCYNENIGVGDLDGDGRGEIIGPNDTHYLDAFQDDGSQMPANIMYGANKFWSQVGVHVDQWVDLRGYANCGTENRPNFANTAPTIADVNGDGVQEVVVVGNVYNCGTDPYTDLYEMPFILNADRTRFADGTYNWTVIPVPDGAAAPLSEDYNLVENNVPNPVVADIDNDGKKEILYPSYDGRMHAYWLDKTEHGSWPYSVYNPADGYITFATEPVVADLNGDSHAEVIFASWVQKGTYQTGKLYILDYLGNPLQIVSLPASYGGDWNGSLAAPTLANIDADPDLEVVLNTSSSGLVAYDLPGTAGARVIWGTGRGSYQRRGSYLP